MPENKNHINDQDIMFDMIKDSKFAISSLAVALEESTSTSFREMLISQINNCIDEHFQLSDLAIHKNWYQPKIQPDQHLQQDSKLS